MLFFYIIDTIQARLLGLAQTLSAVITELQRWKDKGSYSLLSCGRKIKSNDEFRVLYLVKIGTAQA